MDSFSPRYKPSHQVFPNRQQLKIDDAIVLLANQGCAKLGIGTVLLPLLKSETFTAMTGMKFPAQIRDIHSDDGNEIPGGNEIDSHYHYAWVYN